MLLLLYNNYRVLNKCDRVMWKKKNEKKFQDRLGRFILNGQFGGGVNAGDRDPAAVHQRESLRKRYLLYTRYRWRASRCILYFTTRLSIRRDIML